MIIYDTTLGFRHSRDIKTKVHGRSMKLNIPSREYLRY